METDNINTEVSLHSTAHAVINSITNPLHLINRRSSDKLTPVTYSTPRVNVTKIRVRLIIPSSLKRIILRYLEISIYISPLNDFQSIRASIHTP